MFNLSALVKMINTNKDQFIQKEEVENFVQKQKFPSIFNDYFSSINEEINVNEFTNNIAQIAEDNYQKTGNDPSIEFKDKKYDEEYEKCSLEAINEMRDEAYRMYGYKATDKNAFNMLFAQLLKESIKDGSMNMVFSKLQDFEIAQPITMEYIRESGAFDIQLPNGVVLSDIDWSNSREIFNYLSFDENNFSNTSKEHLPEGYDPQQVFELGKSSGLGIDEVHAMGYTGEGVSFAMIDSGTLCADGYNEDGTRKMTKHNGVRFADYQEAPSADKKWINHFHGLATSYIAQEIAPEADLYYYAATNTSDKSVMNREVLENLKAILEKNKSLPDDKKIRFISMSMPLYGGEEAKQVAAELEAQGVWIYYSGCPEDNRTGYLGKKDPMGDPNDFNNYQIENGSRIDVLPDGTVDARIRENLLYINSGNRTVPDPSSPTAFRHDSRASQSWSVPVLAGYYTLACQADPSMTKEKFMRLAEETAQITTSTMPQSQCVGDPNNEYDWRPVGRSEQTTQIKIIDIKALLQAIEAEKSQQAQ